MSVLSKRKNLNKIEINSYLFVSVCEPRKLHKLKLILNFVTLTMLISTADFLFKDYLPYDEENKFFGNFDKTLLVFNEYENSYHDSDDDPV